MPPRSTAHNCWSGGLIEGSLRFPVWAGLIWYVVDINVLAACCSGSAPPVEGGSVDNTSIMPSAPIMRIRPRCIVLSFPERLRILTMTPSNLTANTSFGSTTDSILHLHYTYTTLTGRR